MAVIHIKNIHNHKIKVGLRNEPLPPYFDGYVDTLTGDIVDPVSNVDEFLQSVKDEVDAKVGNIDSFISKSQTDLDTSKASMMDVVNELSEIVDKNNKVLVDYVFNNTEFKGEKEMSIRNGQELDVNTLKFVKHIVFTATLYCMEKFKLSDESRTYNYLRDLYNKTTPNKTHVFVIQSEGDEVQGEGWKNRDYDIMRPIKFEFIETFSPSDLGNLTTKVLKKEIEGHTVELELDFSESTSNSFYFSLRSWTVDGKKLDRYTTYYESDDTLVNIGTRHIGHYSPVYAPNHNPNYYIETIEVPDVEVVSYSRFDIPSTSITITTE